MNLEKNELLSNGWSRQSWCLPFSGWHSTRQCRWWGQFLPSELPSYSCACFQCIIIPLQWLLLWLFGSYGCYINPLILLKPPWCCDNFCSKKIPSYNKVFFFFVGRYYHHFCVNAVAIQVWEFQSGWGAGVVLLLSWQWKLCQYLVPLCNSNWMASLCMYLRLPLVNEFIITTPTWEIH